MIFKAILNNAEPFALNLEDRPWRVSVRTQVILGFVTLGLGKGGLFITSFLFAMAWLEDGWLVYGVPCALATTLALIAGYISMFGRIEARFDGDNGVVHLVQRIPFHRSAYSEPIKNYLGVALHTSTDGQQRTSHTVTLVHPNGHLNAPMLYRRHPDAPVEECATYAKALSMPIL